MSNFSLYLKAARLRTLPLAFAGIILGALFAASQGFFNVWILILCLLTTLFFQVLANFANDLGDGLKGTDDNRTGEQRMLATGAISEKGLRKATQITAILSGISGTVLSLYATKGLAILYPIIFIFLTLLSIWAAVRYTYGTSAYGYSGLGDIAVIVFFGWLAVGGSYFLQSHTWDIFIFFPASAIGVLAASVLNLNNIRDIETDKLAQKSTIAGYLGFQRAKQYQYILLVLGMILPIFYTLNHSTNSMAQYIYVLFWPFFWVLIANIYKAHKPQYFDGFLKTTAIGTLIYALLIGISLLIV